MGKLNLMFIFIVFFSAGIFLGKNAEATSLYDIKVESIEGKQYHLSEYRGKVLLVVNTASECGYTPQYKALQLLYNVYGNKGMVVLGIPCNQFGTQEPGTEEEIKKFCEIRYGVTFPMLKKADVKGPKQHPLYRYLLQKGTSSKDIAWNFEKFLIGRDGQIIGRFLSGADPLSEPVVSAIETALGKGKDIVP